MTLFFAIFNVVFYSLLEWVQGPFTCLLYVKFSKISVVAPALTLAGAYWARSGYQESTMLIVDDPNFKSTFYTAVAGAFLE